MLQCNVVAMQYKETGVVKVKKVTMQQIADQVGVSKFAVSQALSGKPGIGEDTRAKIIQTATALGYYSQPHTTRLKLKRRMQAGSPSELAVNQEKSTVIILIPNVRFQNRESSYWGRIIDGVTLALEQQGIGVMIVTENNSDGFLRVINPNGVLGLIGIGYISNQLLLEIRNAEIPFVLIDHEDPLISCDTIFINNYECMRKLTIHAAYLGHQSMRFVGNPEYSRSFYDRMWGFRSAMEELRLQLPASDDKLMALDDSGQEMIENEIRDLVQQKHLPTVFVCANDFFAYTVLKSLVSFGVKVPAEVSVTGFDDIEPFEKDMPPLTTVQVPNELMGKRAVDILLKRLRELELPYEKLLIHGDIIVRQSLKKL
jgi:LacI family transcriptional regulator